MVIGIDAHNLEGNRTGVGRYLLNLLQEWSKLSSKFKAQSLKFILYFKNEIPLDAPQSELFEYKLLSVGSTAKFMHWDFWRAAKKDKVDILFCPGYIAPIFWRGKLALTLHDIIYEAHPEWFEWKSWADKILLRWVSKISARQADIVFSISEFSRDEIINCYHVPKEKIVLTSLAADPSLSVESHASDINIIKGKYNIKNKFAFFVASVFERRHLPEVINAFLRLNRADYQLLIAGRDYTDGKKVDKMSAKINKELGRNAILRVDFVADTDLRLLYGACAFFIWLSDYEGFGLPPLEAMACGAPVITSDATSLKEVAGGAALLIKNNNDVEEIYQTMKQIIDDEGLRQKLSEQGREQAGKFSWERCAKITLEYLIS